MKTSVLIILLALLGLSPLQAQPSDYPELKAKAESLYAEGSFAKANEVYQQAKALKLAPVDSRWVAFRLADTQWRSQAATQTADTTQLDRARHELEALVRDVTRTEDQDRVWAESAGVARRYFWTRRNSQSWGEAWPHYRRPSIGGPARTDLELARQRYFAIVWTIARPPQQERYYYYGYYGNHPSAGDLDNALKIAKTDNDKAHAHYLIAMTLRQQGGDWEQRQRVPEEFEAAISPAKAPIGMMMPFIITPSGCWARAASSPSKNGGGAGAGLREGARDVPALVKEFKKGETRYWEQAQQQIKNITDPQVNVSVGNIFLPDSEIQYALNWRNVKRIEFALYPVDLNRDVNLRPG